MPPVCPRARRTTPSSTACFSTSCPRTFWPSHLVHFYCTSFAQYSSPPSSLHDFHIFFKPLTLTSHPSFFGLYLHPSYIWPLILHTSCSLCPNIHTSSSPFVHTSSLPIFPSSLPPFFNSILHPVTLSRLYSLILRTFFPLVLHSYFSPHSFKFSSPCIFIYSPLSLYYLGIFPAPLSSKIFYVLTTSTILLYLHNFF